ncbi:MAG: valine--tRNA ligase [Chloroflexota bacterium]|nr:valine--tRNA ligase [Chloroflexota bacterium]
MAEKTMSKTYDPTSTEQRLYEWWESKGYFRPETQFELGLADPQDKPFVISMPPSNVTGELHIGHAMVMGIQDVMIRYHRMRGEPTLWLPGNDHASIGTHNVIEKALDQRTCDDLLTEIGYPLPEDDHPLTRWDLGREWFLKLGWAWKEHYGNTINQQIRRLGGSCDWQRERFTMDEGLSQAVRETFVRLYEEGLIYQGEYLVNWCPHCTSAISDLEVIHWEEETHLWYIRYLLINDDWDGPEEEWRSGQWGRGATEWIEVATTRPETLLGDTAVAVNPSDERYEELVGRTAVLPSVGRHIPVITDKAVDPSFGTGAVKITPAHDPDDYEIGQRHELEVIDVLTDTATMNEKAGFYQGEDRYECRENIVVDLEREGLLVKTEDYTHSVGHCQRCDTVIEPRVSPQWFVKVKPLAERAIKAVREGQVQFIPERFTKVYLNWMEGIHDWCISRQLYWGHRIPVWYCEDCGALTVSREDPTECEACGSPNIHQDPDILDTWFSSALWPFSTLGWPEDTEDLHYFYPTTVMETGYDIIFFWVARMIMMGLECTGEVPFHHVYLHGMVLDEEGRKMSRSWGNVIDPMEVVEEYGSDALRFTLLTNSTPGNDTRLSLQKVEASRNFANKIWNAARFVFSSLAPQRPTAMTDEAETLGHQDALTLPDRWILSRHNRLIASVNRLMENYQFGEAGRQIQDFLWGEFCDWYIEISKIRLYGEDEEAREVARRVLIYVLERTLRLLHPFMPFVTEEIWQKLTNGEGRRAKGKTIDSIMLARWPEPEERDEKAEVEMEVIMALVRDIRNARAEYRVDPGKRIAATIAGGERTDLLLDQREVLVNLARLDREQLAIFPTLAEKPRQAVTLVVGGVECYLPLAGMVDLEAERKRLARELDEMTELISRSEQLLDNEEFVAKAPAHVVDREREKLAQNEARKSKLQVRLDSLG